MQALFLIFLTFFYLLIISPLDKLVAYVILLTLVSIIILFCYKIYCNKKFEIAHYKKVSDYSLTFSLTKFFSFLCSAISA